MNRFINLFSYLINSVKLVKILSMVVETVIEIKSGKGFIFFVIDNFIDFMANEVFNVGEEFHF